MSMFTSLLILNIISLACHTFGQDTLNENTDDTCYADTENPYLYFSSKTTYNAVYYRNNVETIPSECKPRQLWMLIRHGERYPLKRKMEAFQKLSKLRNHIVHNHELHHRGRLCDADLQNLKDWTADNVPLKESDHLAKQGYDNLREIGDRTWNKYNELFKSSYSESVYKVQYTKHEKTKHSAEAFTYGLFGEKVQLPEATSEDLLTMIYPECKVLPIPGADDVPNGGKYERSLFKEGPIVADMIQNISKRLGFTNNLEYEDIENMYDMCRYKKAWVFEDLSPWCAAFLESDLKILEYIGDLSYYYNSGHGYSANLRTGCPLVQDMVHRFRDIVNNRYNNQPKALFYFGHSTTLYNLFARLGLAKDTERITHTNYDAMTNRKWRTSLIGPFSANFAAVLLKCNSGIKNRVVFYHNESPFRFKECHGYVCPWDTIEEMYGNITDPSTCNYNFCEDQQYSTQTLSTIQQTEKLQSNYEVIKHTTTERSNAIVKEIPKTYETNRNRILHRTVTKIKDTREINRSPTEKDTEFTINRVYVRNLQLDKSDSEAFKQKNTRIEREIHLSWLFVSFMVVIVVLVLCNHYTSKRNQSKNGYEKMFTLQMNKINKI